MDRGAVDQYGTGDRRGAEPLKAGSVAIEGHLFVFRGVVVISIA